MANKSRILKNMYPRSRTTVLHIFWLTIFSLLFAADVRGLAWKSAAKVMKNKSIKNMQHCSYLEGPLNSISKSYFPSFIGNGMKLEKS